MGSGYRDCQLWRSRWGERAGIRGCRVAGTKAAEPGRAHPRWKGGLIVVAKYEIPELKVIFFENEDLILTSTETDPDIGGLD